MNLVDFNVLNSRDTSKSQNVDRTISDIENFFNNIVMKMNNDLIFNEVGHVSCLDYSSFVIYCVKVIVGGGGVNVRGYPG